MTTYPLALPATNGFSTSNWSANDTTAEAVSPYTGQSQVTVYPAQWWECDLTLVVMKRADYEMWNGFLLSLRGRSGSFLLGDPLGATPLGSASVTPGTPAVKGAAQLGSALIIDGLPTSVSGYLKSGDYIQLGSGSTSRLHKLTADANTNGSGEATLALWPDLRESPADNATVVVSGAKGIFKRTSDRQEWAESAGGIATIAFGIKEVL